MNQSLPATSGVRLAELLATLSLGTDLGRGQPMEHIIRQCLISLRLSERLGFDESDRAVVYYAGLLSWVGCHVDAYEQAKWFGDDISFKSSAYLDGGGLGFLFEHFGEGKPTLERVRLGVDFLSEGRRWMESLLENHWLATEALTLRLGLGSDVRDNLQQTFERWDGKHSPGGLKGEEILLPARLIVLADVAEVFYGRGGVEAAVSVARERSGTQFDPAMVRLFCDEAPLLFSDLDAAASWDSVIAAEPALQVVLSDERFEDALEAIGDFTDIKSPFTIGHSRRVADLAAQAGRSYGLPEDDVVTLRRAGLVHDFGRLGVSNAIWDKKGKLTQAETERVRLHPYLTGRMLSFSPGLARLGAIAVQHSERLDGSGYPRGLTGDAMTLSGKILAAADLYQALTELRPHRAAFSPEEAATQLRAEVTSGRIDPDAAEAVLHSAGHRVKPRREWPRELTQREVEVLRLVARGFSNKEIADRLVISRKTAGNHVEHIYTKIGVSNRARAGLFAMKYGLMTDLSTYENS